MLDKSIDIVNNQRMEKLKSYLQSSGITQAEFAKSIGRTQGTVSLWLSRGKIPADNSLFLAIESATNNMVTRKDLRPELFLAKVDD